MGQAITVVEKPSAVPGVMRFETNRSLTGTGHERYRSGHAVAGHRPPDELARRLFDHGGVDGVHIYSNIITVDLADGFDGAGLREIVHDLFIHYRPGVLPPSDRDLTGADAQPAE
ncbi:MAG: NifU N-terminal domain-containing protein [Acidimicrobiales bacterium]